MCVHVSKVRYFKTAFRVDSSQVLPEISGGYTGTPVTAQGAALLRASTPVWVQGTVLAVQGQHSCVSPGDCTGSQGPTLLCGSRGSVLAVKGQHSCESTGLYWQSRASTTVRVHGSVLRVKGQHSYKSPRGCTGSQGPALFCRSRGLYR